MKQVKGHDDKKDRTNTNLIMVDIVSSKLD